MKKGHKRRPLSPVASKDSEESEVEPLHPALASVDAAIAMSRRVVKESLDLNAKSPVGRYDLPSQRGKRGEGDRGDVVERERERGKEAATSQSHPDASALLDRLKSEEIMKRFYEKELVSLRTQVHASDSVTLEVHSLRKQLEETKEALNIAENNYREVSLLASAKDRTLTSKLVEMEELVRTLNRELRKKNKEIGKMYGIIASGEERETALKEALSRANQAVSDVNSKAGMEKKLLEDGHSDLRADILILERQLKDKTVANEKTVSEAASLEVRLKAAEHTVEKLTIQIEAMTVAQSDSFSKLKLQLATEESAKLRLSHQLQDLTDLHSHCSDSTAALPRLERKMKDLEATHMQQIGLNLKLQEEVKRLQGENEELKRLREEEMRRAKDEVNQQTAKFAQKIEDLEYQFQKHIKTSQEIRLASSFDEIPTSPSPKHYKRNSKSSASLKAPRRTKS